MILVTYFLFYVQERSNFSNQPVLNTQICLPLLPPLPGSFSVLINAFFCIDETLLYTNFIVFVFRQSMLPLTSSQSKVWSYDHIILREWLNILNVYSHITCINIDLFFFRMSVIDFLTYLYIYLACCSLLINWLKDWFINLFIYWLPGLLVDLTSFLIYFLACWSMHTFIYS